MEKRFGAHLEALIDIPDLATSFSPYIVGKVLPIDVSERKVDLIYYRLPRHMRASTPDEVQTVIWLGWHDSLVGRYDDGQPGYQIFCFVQIIDVAQGSIVAQRNYVGSRPPDTKRGSGERHGSNPKEEIVDFIRGLSTHNETEATAAVKGTLRADIQATAQARQTEIAPTAVAMRTLTAVAAATHQSVLARGSRWPLLLGDTFDTAESGWPTGELDDAWVTGNRLITGGAYRWDVKARKGFVYLGSPDTDAVSDLFLSVEARMVQGPSTAAYGLVFRVVGDQFYQFLAWEDGHFALDLKYEGDWKTLIRWRLTSAIRPGEVNRLSVSAIGSHMLLFINDQFVGEAEDDRLSSGKVGVSVNLANARNAAVIEFDRFELRTP